MTTRPWDASAPAPARPCPPSRCVSPCVQQTHSAQLIVDTCRESQARPSQSEPPACRETTRYLEEAPCQPPRLLLTPPRTARNRLRQLRAPRLRASAAAGGRHRCAAAQPTGPNPPSPPQAAQGPLAVPRRKSTEPAHGVSASCSGAFPRRGPPTSTRCSRDQTWSNTTTTASGAGLTADDGQTGRNQLGTPPGCRGQPGPGAAALR